MKYLLRSVFGLSFILLFNCNNKQDNIANADEIINRSIEISGGNRINTSDIEFDFRDAHYKAKRNVGQFEFVRVSKDSSTTITDYLKNSGFERYLNDSLVKVADSMVTKYSASINSVHYFAVLPYSLDGKAVNKTYLNAIDINGESYHKIKVTFNQDGGGEDFEDIFIYWVHAQTYKVDYIAYSYNEEDGKGYRFRSAFNERYVGNIRFVDYNNYKPKGSNIKLEDLDRLFVEDKLQLLSKIELRNIKVN